MSHLLRGRTATSITAPGTVTEHEQHQAHHLRASVAAALTHMPHLSLPEPHPHYPPLHPSYLESSRLSREMGHL